MAHSFNNEALIYCISGTGNSLLSAGWVRALFEKENYKAQLIRIENSKLTAEIIERNPEYIVVTGPVHGFTLPWMLIKFFLRLPRGKGRKAITIISRAGIRIGKVFPPGLSGTSNYLAALILRLKGYRIRGFLAVDLPSNWLSIHPPVRRHVAEKIIALGQRKVERFMNKIFAGKNAWLTLDNIYEFIFGIGLIYVSFLYLIIGRFGLAKLYFTNEKCDGCKICAESCPVGAIELWGMKKDKPYWTYNCESCMRCMNLCPRKAIETHHGYLAWLIWVTTFSLSSYLLIHYNDIIPGMELIRSGSGRFIVDLIYVYPAIFISYFLFYFLSRIPIMNKFFSRTALTHYYGRYIAPGTKKALSKKFKKRKDHHSMKN
ncbi:EFR1 family ferrodoxin [Bacteroidota bacterium]